MRAARAWLRPLRPADPDRARGRAVRPAVGDWDARPGPAEGEAACLAASTADGPLGNVGAGMGATVGKTAGPEHMTKGGLGWAVVEAGPVTVGALAAVNAGGDVLDEDGTVLAGARVPGGARAALRERLAAPTADGEVRPEPVRRPAAAPPWPWSRPTPP